MKSFGRRLKKLEAARWGDMACVILKPGESTDEAIVRHMAERPQDARAELIVIAYLGDPPQENGIKVNMGKDPSGETGEGGRR